MNPTLVAEWSTQRATLLIWPHASMDWGPELGPIHATYQALIDIITPHQEVVLIQHEQLPTNDTWVRDTGPLFLTDGTALDFRFNGWGNKYPHDLDDSFTSRFIHPDKRFDLVLEGGSIDSNGQGTLLTTRTCLLAPSRNPGMIEQDYQDFFKQHCGINQILWVEHDELAGDDTDGHIDNMARFVTPDTIVYSSFNNKEIAKSFNLIELPKPNNKTQPASYCNFIHINEGLIVPTFDDPNDNEALNIFKEIYPNRKIYALNSNELIKQGGGLHCASIPTYQHQ